MLCSAGCRLCACICLGGNPVMSFTEWTGLSEDEAFTAFKAMDWIASIHGIGNRLGYHDLADRVSLTLPSRIDELRQAWNGEDYDAFRKIGLNLLIVDWPACCERLLAVALKKTDAIPDMHVAVLDWQADGRPLTWRSGGMPNRNNPMLVEYYRAYADGYSLKELETKFSTEYAPHTLFTKYGIPMRVTRRCRIVAAWKRTGRWATFMRMLEMYKDGVPPQKIASKVDHVDLLQLVNRPNEITGRYFERQCEILGIPNCPSRAERGFAEARYWRRTILKAAGMMRNGFTSDEIEHEIGWVTRTIIGKAAAMGIEIPAGSAWRDRIFHRRHIKEFKARDAYKMYTAGDPWQDIEEVCGVTTQTLRCWAVQNNLYWPGRKARGELLAKRRRATEADAMRSWIVKYRMGVSARALEDKTGISYTQARWWALQEGVLFKKRASRQPLAIR